MRKSRDRNHMRQVVAILAFTLSLSTASIRTAKSQLQLKSNQVTPAATLAIARNSDNTLEIPVVVNPGRPRLDPTFVGYWCGSDQLTSSDHPVRAGVQRRDMCISFGRRGDSLVLESRIRDVTGLTAKAGVTVHVVSESAEAIGAREIVATDIIDMTQASRRSTTTLSFDMKLTGKDNMEFTKTSRVQVTDLNYAPTSNATAIWSGSLHKSEQSEFVAWMRAHANEAEVGGNREVVAPGAR